MKMEEHYTHMMSLFNINLININMSYNNSENYHSINLYSEYCNFSFFHDNNANYRLIETSDSKQKLFEIETLT